MGIATVPILQIRDPLRVAGAGSRATKAGAQKAGQPSAALVISMVSLRWKQAVFWVLSLCSCCSLVLWGVPGEKRLTLFLFSFTLDSVCLLES